MANKIGKILKTDSQSRVLFVDPNPKDIITSEDLTINVELKTFKKSRTAIELVKTKDGVNAFVSTGSDGKVISFIDGSKVNNNNTKSLTTHYTELSTDFNKAEKDLETLGIKDIQIEFNSSNVPLVKINFVDVRGKLFEMGNNSPYNVFFELPFPIFELTVKGYYGGAVTYKLHLLKFNGSFNSSNGTFEIKCEFVGYTYAFLSDILIGYLKAIPYTEKGSRMVNEINTKNDFTFLTFDELDGGVKTLQTKITNLKKDNEVIKAIAKSEDKIAILENFRNTFVEISRNLAGINEEKVIGSITSDNIILSSIINLQLEQYNIIIKNFFEGEGNDNDSLDNYKLTRSFFNIIEGENLFRHVKKSDFINSDGSLKLFDEYKELNDGRQLTPAQKDATEYKRYSSKIESNKEALSNDNEFTVFDFKKSIDEINNTLTRLKVDSNERINELGDEFTKQIRESFSGEDFNSSIGDFLQILCSHVDIFMDVLREVAVDAESKTYSPFRNEQLKNLIPDNSFITYNGGNDINGLGSVKAFPEYRTIDETGALKEEWIGNLAPNMPEVLFVEDLLNSIVKSAQRDKKTSTALEEGNTELIKQWYPISPFDVSLYNSKNPYEVIGNTGKAPDYIRLVIQRLFILAAYGNRNLSNAELLAMAKIEANNAFNSVKNSDIKAYMSTFGQKDSTSAKSAAVMINEATATNGFTLNSEAYRNYAYRGITPKIMVEDGGQYNYVYIPETGRGSAVLRNNVYLPLNSVNDNKNDYNGDFLMANNGVEISLAESIKLRDSGYIFFSNIKDYIKEELNKRDDGSTFIDIIDSSVYENLSFNLAEYGEKIVTDNSPNKENQIVGDSLSTNLFNGKAGITEIFTINGSPTATVFFKEAKNTPFIVSKKNSKNVIRTRLISPDNKEENLPSNNFVIKIDDFIVNPVDGYIPYLGFYADSQRTSFDEVFYSLFGSDLYYQQNNKGKAFLILSCLPFNIDSEKILNNEILSLFNSRAAFVNVPYVWTLLIGAYIDRLENEYMKFSNTNFSFIPDNEIEEFPLKDEIFGHRSSSNSNLVVTESFNPLDSIIKNLPVQIKDKFKKEFNDWVTSSEFNEIINTLEIFPSSYSTNDRYNFWIDAYKKEHEKQAYSFPKTSVKDEYILSCVDLSNFALQYAREGSNNLLNGFIIDRPNSVLIADAISKNEDNGSPFNFHLELKPTSKGSTLLTNLIRKNKVIVNSSWTPWVESDVIVNENLIINENIVKNYLLNFNEEFSKLYGEDLKSSTAEKISENNKTKLELFNATDSNDIKLNIYKKLKLIYDKWISGTSSRYEGVTEGNLFKSFKFIDRSYNDISKKLLINPVNSLNFLNSNYNKSFYSYLSIILTDNNMDFHALPAYINYNNISEMEKVFSTYSYNESASQSIAPAFICMYIGERSNNLDLVDSNFKNDGTSITFSVDSNGDKTINSDTILKDMQGTEGDKIPIFLVNYADDKQSIFTNIGLDQAEFAATDESLIITDNLVSSRGMGQNLFDIYNSRAYSANIDMLGNAMIQPMMYFQLSNIPMFHGLYTIIKVNHSIKPNSMTTSFTGSRIREVKTKMVDASTIFVNLLGSLSDIDTSSASLDYLSTSVGGTSKSGKKIDALSPYITHQLGDKIGIKRQDRNEKPQEDYGLFPVIEYLTELGKEWNKTMFGKNPNLYPEYLLYGDISRFKGEIDTDHKTHNNGLSIDIRPLPINPNDYYNNIVKVGAPNYSPERNMELFKFINKFNDNPRWTPWKKKFGNRSPIELIYFNDTNIINEFKDNTNFRVFSESGHNNHFHIKFNIPDKYLDLLKDPKSFIEEPMTISSNNDLSKTLIDLGYKEGTTEYVYAYFIGKKEGYLNGGSKSAPVRNNNPGNLSGVNEFKDIDPNVIKDPENTRFAKFSSLDKGTKALVEKKIIKWANGNYPATQTNGNDINYQNNNNVPQSVRNIAGKKEELTFEQFTYIYAPPHENDTEKYINSIVANLNSQGINVTRTSKIKDFLSGVA